MKTMKFILIVTIGLLFSGCPNSDDGPDFFITLVNDSPENIYFEIRGFSEGEVIPENYLFELSPERDEYFLILSGEAKKIDFDNDTDTVIYSTFFYKVSTLEANDWETIKDNGLYDARFDLTLEELEAMNFEIVYDGM